MDFHNNNGEDYYDRQAKNVHPEASQYMEFHESDRLAPEGKQKVALVDIDETICFYPSKRRYDLAEPSLENIAKINEEL
jgi:hypothetical protein